MGERITDRELKTRMFYTAPDQDALLRHRAVQEAAFDFASKLLELCPNPSRELSIAIRSVEEARMWANASIAHRQSVEADLGVRPTRTGPKTVDDTFGDVAKPGEKPLSPKLTALADMANKAPFKDKDDDAEESDPFTGLELPPGK